MKDVINDWIFHYCPYNKNWKACNRENATEMFNNNKSKKVIKSKDIDVLVELINITDGNIFKMNKLAK